MSTPPSSFWDNWTPAPDPVPTGPRLWRRVARTTTSCLLFLGVFVLLVVAWPHQLGGRFGTTVVVGHSMDGTYATGDLLFTASHKDYVPGEVIVYSIQYGEVNGTVVHRIIGEQDGEFTTQGDNNPYPDPWPVTPANIRGTVELHVPHAGWGVLITKTPIFLMFLCGALVTYVLWPRGERASDEPESWAPPRGAPYLIPPPAPSTPAGSPQASAPAVPTWAPIPAHYDATPTVGVRLSRNPLQ